jgi:hopanoid biosynthesis associated protein HpnK
MRRLIVNADDFGRSHSINRAVIEAHQRGILTTASLMVNGGAAAEAVALAKENPRLGVGLHLSLVCGTSALPCSEIPALVDRAGNFLDNPVAAGMRYFFSPACRKQLGAEIAAQFARFRETGLPMDHVNGHLHFHMHPTVFGILSRNTRAWGIERMRLTRDPFWLNAKLGNGRWFYRISHAIIFGVLAATQRGRLCYLKVKSTKRVFGLLQNALVDEAFVRGLLPLLPEGDSELYSHPSLDEFKNEFDALTSPAVRAEVDRLGIQLIRYSDLK